MEVLKERLKFRACGLVRDVEERAHNTKPKAQRTHNQKKYEQDNQGNYRKEKVMKMMKTNRRKVSPVPAGCFPVYVGPNENEKQRFVVRVETANHPLFQILLEEAESKYGEQRQGPISLPCHVDLFYKVLAEVDIELEGSTNHNISLNVKDDIIEYAVNALSPLLASWKETSSEETASARCRWPWVITKILTAISVNPSYSS